MISTYAGGKKIMDVGCATGEFLCYMKSRDWITLGIEPDENARHNAKMTYDLDIYDESYLDQVPDNSMDVITLWHVLEHVADLSGRMNSLKRILKPTGILILAVPNADCYDADLYKDFWAGYDVPRHLYHFSRKSMEKLLTLKSFDLITIKPMFFDAYYVSMLSEKYKNGKIKWISGFWSGFCSNWKARKTGNYSSLVFIAKKK
jgi:predicted SAM-dependent methyltransferase